MSSTVYPDEHAKDIDWENLEDGTRLCWGDPKGVFSPTGEVVCPVPSWWDLFRSLGYPIFVEDNEVDYEYIIEVCLGSSGWVVVRVFEEGRYWDRKIDGSVVLDIRSLLDLTRTKKWGL